MLGTNVKIAGVVVLTLAAYSLVANLIPQIESEVPEELDLSGEVTPAELVAAGERIFKGAGGCTACHGLGTRAPNLLTSEAGLGPIGARCTDRRPGLDCKEYLHESLTAPAEFLVEGYAAIMPDVSRILSSDQVWALVAFLQSRGGEVTVSGDDMQSAESGGTEEPTTASGSKLTKASDPLELLNGLGCLVCHQLGEQGNAIGPALTDVGARRDAEYIRRSILEPAADTAPGYEAFAGTMPPNFGDQMTAAQLEALVMFLASQHGG